ncbi:MAG: hypothetical protein HY063_09955 [Bacteroidetes bacterium]|nr:hypothetical protein [Bacteroidota bacterium]
MKKILAAFYFSFFIYLFAFSQSARTPSEDSTKLKIPADTSSYCIVETNDGLLLKGRIIGQKQGEISFRDNNLGLLSLELKNISFIEQAGNGMYFLFYMKDGGLLHGKIISQTATEIEIETKSTGKKIIPLERIKEMRLIDEKDIRRKGKYRYPNFNAPRYFLTPSAIPMNKEEGYYQTMDFLYNNFNYGIAKSFSIGSGAILPLGFYVMPKYGRKVSDVMYLGAGAVYGQTLVKFRQTNFKLGALYGLATFGNANNNLTFGTGYTFSDVNNETTFYPKPLIMVSGALRISRRFQFVGENIFLPFKNCHYVAEGKVCDYFYQHTAIYGFRFLKEKLSIDLGILHYPQDIFKAFPYLALAIKF